MIIFHSYYYGYYYYYYYYHYYYYYYYYGYCYYYVWLGTEPAEDGRRERSGGRELREFSVKLRPL